MGNAVSVNGDRTDHTESRQTPGIAPWGSQNWQEAGNISHIQARKWRMLIILTKWVGSVSLPPSPSNFPQKRVTLKCSVPSSPSSQVLCRVQALPRSYTQGCLSSIQKLVTAKNPLICEQLADVGDHTYQSCKSMIWLNYHILCIPGRWLTMCLLTFQWLWIQ